MLVYCKILAKIDAKQRKKWLILYVFWAPESFRFTNEKFFIANNNRKKSFLR